MSTDLRVQIHGQGLVVEDDGVGLPMQSGKAEAYLNLAIVGESDKPADYLSWVNGTPSPDHGSHVEGVRKALRKAGWKAGSALVHVVMCDPRYAGPTRNKVHRPELVPIIATMLAEAAHDLPLLA